MPNRIAAKVSRAVCASFAVACVFGLLAACGSEPEPVSAALSYSASYPQMGETSPEELVYLSSVVARVRFISASAGVRSYPSDDGRGPAPVFVFRFRVVEYLKGSGDSELTVRVLAAPPGRRRQLHNRPISHSHPERERGVADGAIQACRARYSLGRPGCNRVSAPFPSLDGVRRLRVHV